MATSPFFSLSLYYLGVAGRGAVILVCRGVGCPEFQQNFKNYVECIFHLKVRTLFLKHPVLSYACRDSQAMQGFSCALQKPGKHAFCGCTCQSSYFDQMNKKNYGLRISLLIRFSLVSTIIGKDVLWTETYLHMYHVHLLTRVYCMYKKLYIVHEVNWERFPPRFFLDLFIGHISLFFRTSSNLNLPRALQTIFDLDLPYRRIVQWKGT
jgi:hypothetical protein